MDHIVPVDPGMLKFYEALSLESPPEAATWPLDLQRAAWNSVCLKFRAPIPDDVAVLNRVLDGVPCQIFCPKGEGLKPGLIYFQVGRESQQGEWANVQRSLTLAVRLNENLIAGDIQGQRVLTIKTGGQTATLQFTLYVTAHDSK